MPPKLDFMSYLQATAFILLWQSIVQFLSSQSLVPEQHPDTVLTDYINKSCLNTDKSTFKPGHTILQSPDISIDAGWETNPYYQSHIDYQLCILIGSLTEALAATYLFNQWELDTGLSET